MSYFMLYDEFRRRLRMARYFDMSRVYTVVCMFKIIATVGILAIGSACGGVEDAWSGDAGPRDDGTGCLVPRLADLDPSRTLVGGPTFRARCTVGCHASWLSGEQRNGVPVGLNFDDPEVVWDNVESILRMLYEGYTSRCGYVSPVARGDIQTWFFCALRM